MAVKKKIARDLNKDLMALVRWEMRERFRANCHYRCKPLEADPTWKLHSESFIRGYRVKLYYDTTLTEEEIRRKTESIERAIGDSILKQRTGQKSS